METEFDTKFIDRTIKEPLYNDKNRYGEYPSQMLLSAWYDANDSISPRFIDREEWEEMGDEILMDEDEQGKKILYIPEDLTLIETVDIVAATDKDTYRNRPELSTKGVEKIEELAQTFRKAGKYIEENLGKVDKGRNLAENLSKKFLNYGYDLESRIKKVNKEIEVIPPVELTEEDRNKLDKWLVGKEIYTRRMVRITGKAEPTTQEIEIHKEDIGRERERFFKGYFKALTSKGYEGEEDEPWERSSGPISKIQGKTKRGIENTIKEPEHQILESIFRRGLEGLLMELNVPQEKTRLYDYLDIPGLKKDLEEVRRNNPDNLDKISEVEREIANKIHFAVAANYRYEENSFKPSEIQKGDYLNCLGSTLLGTALLEEVGIKCLYVFPPEHSMTFLVTSNGKLYIQDFTPRKKPFTHIPETDEITNDMFEDETDILELARTTEAFYVRRKWSREIWEITQNKEVIVATVLNNLGSSYYDLGQYTAAIEAYKKAIELYTNNVTIYYNLGIQYAKLEQWENAIGSYKKAIELNPNNADTYYNLGFSYQNLGQNHNAIKAYKKTIEFNPNNAVAYNNLGLSYAKEGLYNDAIEVYKKAIQLNPNDSRAYNNLGVSYKKIGQWNNAIEAYKNALSIRISEIEERQLPKDSYIEIRRTCKNLLRVDPGNEDAKKYLEIAEREINSST